MTDEEITKNLEVIVSEMAKTSDKLKELTRRTVRRETMVTLAVACGDESFLSNEMAIEFLKNTPKPTVAEKEKIVLLELGDDGFEKQVLENELKLLEKRAKTVETLAFHTASLRKAEKF